MSTVQRLATSSWLKTIVSLVLGGAGLWIVTQGIDLGELAVQAENTNWFWVAAAVFIILVTIVTKTWRWQLLFYPEAQTIPFRSLLNSLVLGQFFNLLLPVARLGDVARILSLDHEANKAKVLGTLVLEKTLDMIMVVLTLFVLLPFIALPDVINNPMVLTGTAVGALVVLYLLAYQTQLIITIAEFCGRILPARIRKIFLRIVVAGLDGLAALRNVRVAFNLLLISTFIAFLSALTPYIMFRAFGFELGLAEAAAVNTALLIGSIPSSAPANFGVFEFITILTLRQFGVADEAAMVGYAFVFHLVVLLPVIAWGSLVMARSDWRRWFAWVRTGGEGDIPDQVGTSTTHV